MKFAIQIVQEIISRYKKGEKATTLAKEYMFYKRFKEKYGITPKEYREKHNLASGSN